MVIKYKEGQRAKVRLFGLSVHLCNHPRDAAHSTMMEICIYLKNDLIKSERLKRTNMGDCFMERMHEVTVCSWTQRSAHRQYKL